MEVETKFMPLTGRHKDAVMLKSGTELLLIGLQYSDLILRPGFTEDEVVAGEKYDREVTMCRFFDIADKAVVDVERSELREFVAKQNIINARIKTTRPFIISMTDGGRVEDLPKLSKAGNAVAQDWVVVYRISADENMLITGDGGYKTVNGQELQELKQDERMFFYNL